MTVQTVTRRAAIQELYHATRPITREFRANSTDTVHVHLTSRTRSVTFYHDGRATQNPYAVWAEIRTGSLTEIRQHFHATTTATYTSYKMKERIARLQQWARAHGATVSIIAGAPGVWIQIEYPHTIMQVKTLRSAYRAIRWVARQQKRIDSLYQVWSNSEILEPTAEEYREYEVQEARTETAYCYCSDCTSGRKTV